MDTNLGTLVHDRLTTEKLPPSLQNKIAILLGEQLVGGLVPYVENNYYYTTNTIYVKKSVSESGKKYEELVLIQPIADGKLTRSDISNPKKVKTLTSLTDLMGGPKTEPETLETRKNRMIQKMHNQMALDGYMGWVALVDKRKVGGTKIQYSIGFNTIREFERFFSLENPDTDIVLFDAKNSSPELNSNALLRRIYYFLDIRLRYKTTGDDVTGIFTPDEVLIQTAVNISASSSPPSGTPNVTERTISGISSIGTIREEKVSWIDPGAERLPHKLKFGIGSVLFESNLNHNDYEVIVNGIYVGYGMASIY